VEDLKMKKLKKIFLVTSLAATVFGCQSIPVADNAAIIDIDFQWSSVSGCSSVSPVIQLDNIPKGTHILKFKMVDFTSGYNHGGGEVVYNGTNTIPEGALKSYYGPCPREGIHTYEITVQAINKDGSLILGEGKCQNEYQK
jgi:hypothetical protein